MVSNETPLRLLVQITVIQWFHGIRVFKVFEDVFLNTLQYRLTFLLEDHLMITLPFPIPRNLFFETSSPIETRENRLLNSLRTLLIRFLPYAVFRNKNAQCCTVPHMRENNNNLRHKNPECHTVLLNCGKKTSKETCPIMIHLRLGLPSGILPSRLSIKTLHTNI
jgi:hypothetical protein